MKLHRPLILVFMLHIAINKEKIKIWLQWCGGFFIQCKLIFIFVVNGWDISYFQNTTLMTKTVEKTYVEQACDPPPPPLPEKKRNLYFNYLIFILVISILIV